MRNIANSHHEIAKKWAVYNALFFISIIIYLMHFIYAGAYAFGGNGNIYAYFGFIYDIAFIFIGLFTYVLFVGQKGIKLVAGLIIGFTATLNILILMFLTLQSMDKD